MVGLNHSESKTTQIIPQPSPPQGWQGPQALHGLLWSSHSGHSYRNPDTQGDPAFPVELINGLQVRIKHLDIELKALNSSGATQDFSSHRLCPVSEGHRKPRPATEPVRRTPGTREASGAGT